jgi:hypothetical protein
MPVPADLYYQHKLKARAVEVVDRLPRCQSL